MFPETDMEVHLPKNVLSEHMLELYLVLIGFIRFTCYTLRLRFRIIFRCARFLCSSFDVFYWFSVFLCGYDYVMIM